MHATLERTMTVDRCQACRAYRKLRLSRIPAIFAAALFAGLAVTAGGMQMSVKDGSAELQADGTPDPRGVCKMRETWPHEAARLAMIYAVAGEITGDTHWTKLYESLRDEAVDESCRLAKLTERKVNAMPCYSLHQMNVSLEVLLGIEKDEQLRAKTIGAMAACARIARERAFKVRGRVSGSLCSCAEVHLAQMMVPQSAFEWDAGQREILKDAIVKVPAEKSGASRAVHLFASYWRAKRLGLF